MSTCFSEERKSILNESSLDLLNLKKFYFEFINLPKHRNKFLLILFRPFLCILWPSVAYVQNLQSFVQLKKSLSTMICNKFINQHSHSKKKYTFTSFGKSDKQIFYIFSSEERKSSLINHHKNVFFV